MGQSESNVLLELLRAEREIGRVILRYGQAIDQLDFERARTCFHDDAHVRYDEWFDGDLDAAIDWLANSMPRLLGTLHVFGPPALEVDLTTGTAVSETYAINSARYPEDAAGEIIQNVTGTRYFDEWTFEAERWAISSRRTERAWKINQPLPGDPPLP